MSIINEINLTETQKEKIAEDAKKKNSNFVQVYRENMKEIRWLIANHPTASELLFFLMEHMDHYNALAASTKVLEERLGRSRSTISRAVKVLKDNGYIGVLKIGTANVYVVQPDLAWTSWNNKKEYCKFTGNMLVSRKENQDYYDMSVSTKTKHVGNPYSQSELFNKINTEIEEKAL